MAKGKLEVRLKPGERAILNQIRFDNGLISDAAAFRWLLAQGRRVNNLLAAHLKEIVPNPQADSDIPWKESEAARKRIEQLDALSPLCEWDSTAYKVLTNAVAARKLWDKIMAEQQEFERIYNL